MAQTDLLERPVQAAQARPEVQSYDTGHEHSVEHWAYIKCMVSEEDDEYMAQPPKYRTAAGAD